VSVLLELKDKKVGMLVLVAALGYFVDIYDLVLFGMERVSSLNDILSTGLSPAVKSTPAFKALVKDTGIMLFNWQMFGMLVGGIAWGIIGDKKGRLSVLFGSIITYSLANIFNGMVTDTDTYAVLRFVSGFGLAGELGAGITLVAESMSKENRGWGAMIVAAVGLFGAVVAGVVNMALDDWRMSYYIGGGLGMLLLLLRIGVYESGMFATIKESNVKRGDFLMLLSSWKNLGKYLNVILIALPVWYVMGILITLSPEVGADLSPALKATPPDAKLAITLAYCGITIGDIASGWLSQHLKSRKRALFWFLALAVVCCIAYFLFAGMSLTVFYTIVVITGFATGYWAVFMSSAAELFGTNIRATVTTTAPNFVRGGAILLTSGFLVFSKSIGLGNVTGAIIMGVITFAIGFIALWRLEETYGKDLNYVE
jgi:putative MFS transporter